MKKITFWLFIAFLTFLVGLTTAFLYLKFNNSNNQESEISPGHQIFNDKNETAGIPTLNFCELSSNPQKYDGKIVRLSSTLSFSQEGTWFNDFNCKTSNGWINPYVENQEVWNPIERAKEANYSKYGSHELELTVVGKFKIEDTKNAYIIVPFQFEILQVEKVSKSNREIIWEY